MKTIYLIGFMGSGKTSVGKRLGAIMNKPVIDTDEVIEKTYGLITHIFKHEGEEAFRAYESAVLQGIPVKDRIISTGGGIVESKENLDYMHYTGIIINLQASFQEILKRLKYDRGRPMWNQDINDRKKLYDRRQHLYETHADII